MHASQDTPPGQQSPFFRRAYLGLWVLLAVVHLTQVIWFSGWTEVPGGIGDGRLNNLILEHGYQAIRGIYPFTSPGQFFPVEKTLTYSDSHWGTLPLYALARSIGCSETTAFQLWAVLLAAANAVAALTLLRVCRIPWPLAGPICFLAVAPASAVWFAGGHIQLLPLFPLTLALAQVIRWVETRRVIHLVLTVAFLCWLLLSSPYLGFFGCLALGLVGLPCLFLLPRPPTATPPQTKNAHLTLVAATAFLLLVAVPTLLLYNLYFQETRSAGSRPWSELAELAPTWQVWLTAPPGHWLYGGLPDWNPVNLSEKALFSGYIPWLAAGLGLIVAWRKPRPVDRTLALVFALAALAGALFFTDWTGEGDGIFLWLARRFEGLRTFRATGRVIIVVHFLQAFALGLILTLAWRRFASVAAHSALLGFAFLAASETLCLNQPGTAAATLTARRDAVLSAWEANGDRPILVFAPDPSNQDPTAIHLDAWAATLATGRQTLNGYNGRQPPGYGHFLADPTEAKAWALIHNLGLDPEPISLVTSWGPAGPELGIHKSDSRLVHPLEGFDLQPVWWELSFPIESFVIDGETVHQITPTATVVFQVPTGAQKIRFLFGLRDGAYSEGGDSDGVGLRLSVGTGSSEMEVLHVHWNPRDRDDHRGLQWLEVDLPETEGGRLTLRVDHGPAGNGLWDWPVFGRMEVVANKP